MFSKVCFKEMLVNRRSTSRLAVTLLELDLPTSLANENESWTVYSFWDKTLKIGTWDLAKLYVGVPIANRIRQKDGHLYFTGSWTLAFL